MLTIQDHSSNKAGNNMKLTESKLRYMIRDLLWEGSGDPDGDEDDAQELLDIAADMEKARSGKMGGGARADQAAYDLSDERAASQGRIPFLDWSQNVVDASSTMTGIEDIEDGYDPNTGEQIMPYDAWLGDIDPKVYAQSVDEPSPGDEGSDDWDEMKWDMSELGILPNGALGKLLRENMHDSPQGLPWEFGPKGYLNRPELTQKMSDLEYGDDSAPEDILAIALSNRAEELGGYKRTIDPAPFKDLAMSIYQNYIMGMAGDRKEQLNDITTKIDVGGYFDEDIEDIMQGGEQFYGLSPEHDDKKTQMPTTQDQASGPPGPLSESRLMHLAGLKED